MMSPQSKDALKFEVRLPNSTENYSHSPAARHAVQNGSLDPSQMQINKMNNRKIKMRDTFTQLFPTYPHGVPSAGQEKSIT